MVVPAWETIPEVVRASDGRLPRMDHVSGKHMKGRKARSRESVLVWLWDR